MWKLSYDSCGRIHLSNTDGMYPDGFIRGASSFEISQPVSPADFVAVLGQHAIKHFWCEEKKR